MSLGEKQHVPGNPEARPGADISNPQQNLDSVSQIDEDEAMNDSDMQVRNLDKRRVKTVKFGVNS